MIPYQLLGKTYEIPKTSADFLDSYIKRFKTYLSQNGVSEGYMDDILERINDKLTQIESESSPIKNADIIKIVNDIGEPEDIFPIKGDIQNKHTVKEVLKRPLRRDTKNGILFGVCAGIAKYFDLDPLWVRLVFIACVFLGGTGIILYIILVFLMPAEDQGEKSKSHISKDDSFIKNIETTVNSTTQHGFISSVCSSIGGFTHFLFRLILKIIQIVIAGVLVGFFIAGACISGVILSGNFEIGNQQFLTNIPDALSVAVPLLTTVLLMVIFAVFGNIIGRNLFGKKGWITLSLLTSLGLILLTSGSISLVKEYTWSEQHSSEFEFAFTGKTIDIKNELDMLNGSNNLRAGSIDSVRIEQTHTMTGTIRIKTTETFYTKNQETATKILTSKNNPVFTLSGNVLSLSKNSTGDFKNMVPFSFFNRDITIMIPENVEIHGMHGRYDRIFSERERRRNKMDEVETPEVPEIPEAPEAPEPPEVPELPR